MVAGKRTQAIENITPMMLDKLKELKKNFGLRKFVSREDRSYLQWKNEAENLVIRIFGERSNQREQFESIIAFYERMGPEKPVQDSNAAYYKMVKMGYSPEKLKAMTDQEWDNLLEEKGILTQLKKEREIEAEQYWEDLTTHTTAFKEKMKDAFSAWISELELIIPDSQVGQAEKQSYSGNKSIQVQKTSVSIKINIDQTINQIIENIITNEPDENRAKEAEAKLSELREELKKESPRWSTIKKILEWALNFGREVFIQILPVLLEKYKKQ